MPTKKTAKKKATKKTAKSSAKSGVRNSKAAIANSPVFGLTGMRRSSSAPDLL